MISLADYFGHWFDCEDATPERMAAAQVMLDKVNECLVEAKANGVDLEINPRTATMVAGQTYGGFRPQNCSQGALHSSHKEGRGVDVYDLNEQLDRWLTDVRLAAYGLYREAVTATPTWTHLTDRAPASGARTFQP